MSDPEHIIYNYLGLSFLGFFVALLLKGLLAATFVACGLILLGVSGLLALLFLWATFAPNSFMSNVS